MFDGYLYCWFWLLLVMTDLWDMLTDLWYLWLFIVYTGYCFVYLPDFFQQLYHHFCHHLVCHSIILYGFLLIWPYLVFTIGTCVWMFFPYYSECFCICEEIKKCRGQQFLSDLMKLFHMNVKSLPPSKCFLFIGNLQNFLFSCIQCYSGGKCPYVLLSFGCLCHLTGQVLICTFTTCLIFIHVQFHWVLSVVYHAVCLNHLNSISCLFATYSF